MHENINEFQVGNWVIYLPEGNYCTIKSLSPQLLLEGALQSYTCKIESIEVIEITGDKLQVCGFDVQHPKFIKKTNNGIRVTVTLSSSGIYRLYKNDEEFYKVKYIHEVQNAYNKITGEILQGNLYGVRER